MITLNNKNALALVVGLLCVNNNAYSAEGEQQGVLTAYTASMPSWADVTNIGYNFITSSANSLVTTVTNHVSDEAAFAKLGFPPTNDINIAELAKFIMIKDRYTEAIINNDNNAISSNDIAYLERRHVYCHRAINALPIHSQGIELATFILQNYQSVMNSFEIVRLLKFVQMKKEESEQAVRDLNSQLNVIEENNFAFSVLKQNGAVVEQEQGQDEDRIRIWSKPVAIVTKAEGQDEERFVIDWSTVMAEVTEPVVKRLTEQREDQKEEKE